LRRAENDHAECVKSVETISGLVTQYVASSQTLDKQKDLCSTTDRVLNGNRMKLKFMVRKFNAATVKDKAAQDALADAIKAQELAAKDVEAAQANVQAAQANLASWKEHRAKLLIAIEKQEKIISDLQEALAAAEAASTAVSDFKDKLATALNGLVGYYDEAVRQPLIDMGISEGLNMEEHFKLPKETKAAENLRSGLAATETFCASNMEKLAKLPDIEASGTQLTAICDSQKWDVVAGEVDAVVSTKRQRAVKNLQIAQQKVVKYTGVVADKDAGEVEGVWKAMAIFGDTDFSKNYLSGWRFAADGANKGTEAGFMMELASALKKSRERVVENLKKAKEELQVLNDEKVQVEGIIVVAQTYLNNMIAELEKKIAVYEQKTAEREDAEAKAKIARDALILITAQKKEVEETVAGLESDLSDLEASVKEATDALEATHKAAMGSFMELLHASEQRESESWD